MRRLRPLILPCLLLILLSACTRDHQPSREDAGTATVQSEEAEQNQQPRKLTRADRQALRRLSWRRSQMSDEDFARNGFVNMGFDHFVFSSEDLPEPRYEDAAKLAAMLGVPPRATATFYGPDLQPVTSAQEPGRYGAHIVCELGDGRKHVVRRTLFLLPDDQASIDGPTDEDTAMRLAWEHELGHPITDSDMPADMRAEYWWDAVEQSQGTATTYEYIVIPPPAGDDDQPRPLLIYLHGAGGIKQPNAEAFRDSGLAKRFTGEDGTNTAFDGYIVFPHARGGWQAPAVERLLDELIARFAIDESRVYMAGHSMGAGGTLSSSIAFPERLAAIIPIAGGPVRAEDQHRWDGLGVWVFMGDRDKPQRWPQREERLKELQAAGYDVRYTLLEDTDHVQSQWRTFSRTPELFDWMLAHQRD